MMKNLQGLFDRFNSGLFHAWSAWRRTTAMTDSICLSSIDGAGSRFVLGRRASFWVSAGVAAHTLWTSAAPAMVYRIYAEEWHLAVTTTTAIFAIYPIVVVLTLLGFGDLSDHIGRRATMLIGLAASLAGVFTFAVAPDVIWLFAGRPLMGIGVGLTASPATAAMVEFSAPDKPGARPRSRPRHKRRVLPRRCCWAVRWSNMCRFRPG
jgi:Major Facilitator Superfamily